LIATDRKVLTAAHVISDAVEIIVEFSNGERIGARTVAAATARADVAVLQLERVLSERRGHEVATSAG
jgi:S1-C subfamily serine protease